jgi:hypothetical protein
MISTFLVVCVGRLFDADHQGGSFAHEPVMAGKKMQITECFKSKRTQLFADA